MSEVKPTSLPEEQEEPREEVPDAAWSRPYSPSDAEEETISPSPREEAGRKAQVSLWAAALDWLKRWLTLLTELKTALRRPRASSARPWHIRANSRLRPAKASATDANQLLQRHRDLRDMEKLAEFSAQFRVPESDYFGDPQRVERLIRYLLEANPPWLYVSRVLSGGEQGAEAHSKEFLWREQVTREVEDVTLFVPEEDWRDKPLASLTMRPTRTLEDVWHARLLDQVLPPEIMVDRHNRGEILIPIYQGKHLRLNFRTEERRMEITTRKRVPVPIETEGGSGRGGQLLYFLLDYSASMQGKGATLAMAVIAATLRANMGQRDTRYLFRRYAAVEELWPRLVEPAIQARAVAEKDALLDTILATNFNGSATHVNDALDAAVQDIESLRRAEHLDASILLVTDGRAEIMESTYLRLRAAAVKVHTVMVTSERNPSMERISESFTALDIRPDLLGEDIANSSPTLPQTAPRRAFRI